MRIPVAKKSEIGINGFIRRILMQFFEYPPLCCGSQHPAMRKVNPTEEIDTGSERFNENFVGMERKL